MWSLGALYQISPCVALKETFLVSPEGSPFDLWGKKIAYTPEPCAFCSSELIVEGFCEISVWMGSHVVSSELGWPHVSFRNDNVLIILPFITNVTMWTLLFSFFHAAKSVKIIPTLQMQWISLPVSVNLFVILLMSYSTVSAQKAREYNKRDTPELFGFAH